MARKKRVGEFTCTCSAYKFPHRFGGGSCCGLNVVERQWYAYYGSGICRTCNCLNNGSCDVINGAESTYECEALQEHINFNEIILKK